MAQPFPCSQSSQNRHPEVAKWTDPRCAPCKGFKRQGTQTDVVPWVALCAHQDSKGATDDTVPKGPRLPGRCDRTT